MGNLNTQANVGAAGGVALSRLRSGVVLSGTINGVNTVFTTPEDFVHDLSGTTIAVYYNGMRLEGGVGCDYTVSESGGIGTGFDTVTLTFAPKSGDKLLADYLKA